MQFNVIGGPVAWRPSAVSWGGDRVDVFAVSAQGELSHWWSGDGLNYSFETLGAPARMPKVAPTAVSHGLDRLDVFCVGLDARVHWWSWDGVPPFRHRGTLPQGGLGFPAASVAAVSWGPGRLDVFAVASDGSMQHWWKSGAGGWSQPERVGGDPCAAGPHAVSWGPDRLDVFAVGRDGNLKHWWWDGVWPFKSESFPARLPAVVPHAVSHDPAQPDRSPGRLTVFCIGADAQLHRWRFDPTYPRAYAPTGWEHDRTLGGSLPASDVCAVPAVDGRRLLVFASDRNGLLLAWSVEDLNVPFALGPPPVALDNAGAHAMLPAAVRSVFGGGPAVNLYAAGRVGSEWRLIHAKGGEGGWTPDVFGRAISHLLGGDHLFFRPLSPAEMYVARMVFGDSVPLHRVHVCNKAGFDGRGFTFPTVFNEGTSALRTVGNALVSLLTGIPQPIADLLTQQAFGSSTSYTLFMGPDAYNHPDPAGDPALLDPRALARGEDGFWRFLIHELAHVWQGEHYASGNREYWLNSVVNQCGAALTGGNPYQYDPTAVPDWSANQAEVQAQLVEDWFAGLHFTGFRALDPAHPFYARFIRAGILTKSTFTPEL